MIRINSCVYIYKCTFLLQLGFTNYAWHGKYEDFTPQENLI